MSEINDGGPAFPVGMVVTPNNGLVPNSALTDEIGMSLRDWLAGQALVGILSNHQLLIQIDENIAGSTREVAAKYAVAVADATLEALKGNGKQ